MDVREYLDQDKMWISAEGKEVDITSMSADHAALAARWLQQNATALISVVENALNEDALDGRGKVHHVLALVAQNPRSWIMSTTLYGALNRVARGR